MDYCNIVKNEVRTDFVPLNFDGKISRSNFVKTNTVTNVVRTNVTERNVVATKFAITKVWLGSVKINGEMSSRRNGLAPNRFTLQV